MYTAVVCTHEDGTTDIYKVLSCLVTDEVRAELKKNPSEQSNILEAYMLASWELDTFTKKYPHMASLIGKITVLTKDEQRNMHFSTYISILALSNI